MNSSEKGKPATAPRPAEDAPAGILNLCKPCGLSSARFVYRLRPLLGVRKIGHAGSLDPFADGVLLACVGRATRLAERLMGLRKVYCATLRLGVTNETFDTERPFVPVPDARPATAAAVEAVLPGFVGEIMQVPPPHSAIKIGGVASYVLAKKGRAPLVEARPVWVHAIDLVGFEWPLLRLRIACGRGTYIRSLARDLGAALGCGACCETLTREAIGPFTLAQSVRVLEADTLRAALISPADVEGLLAEAGASAAGGRRT